MSSIKDTIEEYALKMSGEANPIVAFKQWEEERQALAEIADENKALHISFRQYDASMKLAEQIIGIIEKESSMFITQATREKIAEFRKHLAYIEPRRAADRQTITESIERRR